MGSISIGQVFLFVVVTAICAVQIMVPIANRKIFKQYIARFKNLPPVDVYMKAFPSSNGPACSKCHSNHLSNYVVEFGFGQPNGLIHYCTRCQTELYTTR